MKTRKLKLPMPRTDAELEILTKQYFGVPLHLRHLTFEVRKGIGYGWYQVSESYDSYHGEGWAYSKHSSEGYDHSRRFWDTVLGPLGTGGIASSSYGDFTIKGQYRHQQRLLYWLNSRRGKQLDRLRKPFERLALRLVGQGENSAIRGGAVLIDGRADGTSKAS